MVTGAHIYNGSAAMADKAVSLRPLCVWDNVRMDSVCAPEAKGMRDGGRGAVRPQGGGGVDHPTKVQQRKAQTESRFSLSYYPWISSAKSKSLLQSSLSSLLISFADKTPGVLGTLFSNIE